MVVLLHRSGRSAKPTHSRVAWCPSSLYQCLHWTVKLHPDNSAITKIFRTSFNQSRGPHRPKPGAGPSSDRHLRRVFKPPLLHRRAVLVLDLPNWFWLSLGGAVGLCVGSFLNVVIYRLPRGMSLSHPPSTCPGCGARIPPYLNVPVLGYVVLRGKARCCKMQMSPRYPLIELLGGVLGCSVVLARVLPDPSLPLHIGFAHFSLYLGLCAALVAAAAIDLEHMILPDGITLGGTLVGLASAGVRPEVTYLSSTVAAAAGFVVVWLPFIWLHGKWRGYPGMGLGDAKLLALAGAWFGGLGVVFVLFGGAVQGTLFAAAALLTGRRLEEPAAVQAERREFREELEAADAEQRVELERMLELDPVLREPDGTTLGARIPFGPFMALALIELALFYEPISVAAEAWLLP